MMLMLRTHSATCLRKRLPLLARWAGGRSPCGDVLAERSGHPRAVIGATAERASIVRAAHFFLYLQASLPVRTSCTRKVRFRAVGLLVASFWLRPSSFRFLFRPLSPPSSGYVTFFEVTFVNPFAEDHWFSFHVEEAESKASTQELQPGASWLHTENEGC